MKMFNDFILLLWLLKFYFQSSKANENASGSKANEIQCVLTQELLPIREF